MNRLIIALLFLISVNFAQSTYLLFSANDIKEIRANHDKYPLFKTTYDSVKQSIDFTITQPVDVPIPKDAAGYTHEKHKQNYNSMYNAGFFYAITGEAKYADFVKLMLKKYAVLYPQLKKHPAAASETPGRIFWQSLNETVFLLNTVQAYDFVKEYLSKEDRTFIETNLFRKLADFFMTEGIHEFNLIHNHGTWSVAAVGMTGLVLKDEDMVQKALYGSDLKKEAGFMKQLECLYAPDGYYTEGAYYARYAILPFFIFAEALENEKPEMKIYEFRNSILKKALYTTLQLTYSTGVFIPINDAIKEKNFTSPEVALSLNYVFRRYGADAQLLWVAQKQKMVTLSYSGLLVAQALGDILEKDIPEFGYKSLALTDGPSGTQGGLSILRTGTISDMTMLVSKYTSHGLSHGHYDKQSICYYNQGREIIPDYGAARFINIDPKYGGRYLPENKSFAMQSIAHNTLVQDEKSHYNGKREISDNFSPSFRFFSVKEANLQATGSWDTTAYPGTKILRSSFILKDAAFEHPVVLDVVSSFSNDIHKFDLPFYYLGHFIETNVKYSANDKERKPLGKANGYQHLWNEAQGTCGDFFSFTFLNGERFYTISTTADTNTTVNFVRIGANDPKFNLKNEPGLILRKQGTTSLFASIIEPHGKFDEVREFTSGVYSSVQSVKTIVHNSQVSIIKISLKNNSTFTLCIWNLETDAPSAHSIKIDGTEYKWSGYYSLIKN